ncbi:hypothetical protein [Alkalilimnicola sp. S0819]|uniref:hypothetical protein n=1 Tax=Alkalilimnicola sp. S0819 TaxID=2613922 RepID=UPI0012616946|nr:hypothetical protein [Alkalilimnicola sp. S0819]KAB7624075.1 hypothetical protein F3N43_06710 [Alkalilimnicola sp. S0819]MPQ16325.1 hypothetical protein [Alkalilimnicola sp. S0819]
MLQAEYLSGKTMHISLKGTLVKSGKVDIDIMLIDKNGIGETILKRYSIDAIGAQLDSTQIRGPIRLLPNKKTTEPTR